VVDCKQLIKDLSVENATLKKTIETKLEKTEPMKSHDTHEFVEYAKRKSSSDVLHKSGSALSVIDEIIADDPNAKSNINITDLIQLMINPVRGISVKNRRWMFRTYKDCFIGTDLVDWFLANNIAKNRIRAVQIGRQLVASNIIEHVTLDHDFKDEYLFYRFTDNFVHKQQNGDFTKKETNSITPR